MRNRTSSNSLKAIQAIHMTKSYSLTFCQQLTDPMLLLCHHFQANNARRSPGNIKSCPLIKLFQYEMVQVEVRFDRLAFYSSEI